MKHRSGRITIEVGHSDVAGEPNHGDEGECDLKDRIDDLLDCVERPLGTLKPRIPQTPESEQAIVALFDAHRPHVVKGVP